MESLSKGAIIGIWAVVAIVIFIGVFLVATERINSYTFLMFGIAIGAIGIIVRLARGR